MRPACCRAPLEPCPTSWRTGTLVGWLHRITRRFRRAGGAYRKPRVVSVRRRGTQPRKLGGPPGGAQSICSMEVTNTPERLREAGAVVVTPNSERRGGRGADPSLQVAHGACVGGWIERIERRRRPHRDDSCDKAAPAARASDSLPAAARMISAVRAYPSSPVLHMSVYKSGSRRSSPYTCRR